MQTKIPEAYFLVLDFGKAGRETVINWESCSRSDVLTQIKRLDYHGSLLSVQHLIPEEGTIRDVSEDFAQAVIDGVADGDDFPIGDLFDFCENALGCLTMAEVERSVAA